MRAHTQLQNEVLTAQSQQMQIHICTFPCTDPNPDKCQALYLDSVFPASFLGMTPITYITVNKIPMATHFLGFKNIINLPDTPNHIHFTCE